MAASDLPRIYIVGAGFAGRSIAREIRAKGVFGTIVAFLDDDPLKIGRRMEGVPVLGPIRDVVNLLHRTPADEAIIAIPSASREFLRELYFMLKRAGFARIRILPDIAQIVEGDAHLVQAREIDPQDLLGRTPVAVGLRESLAWLRGKRVIITGAGGSIGSELSRQLLSAGVERLYLFGHGENSIYQIDRELRLLQAGGVRIHCHRPGDRRPQGPRLRRIRAAAPAGRGGLPRRGLQARAHDGGQHRGRR